MKITDIKKASKNPCWEFKAAAKGIGELYIYGEIVSDKWDDTDTTAASFKKDLDALGDIKTLNIFINSPGGSVFQGQTIYSILMRVTAYKNAYVDGLAASIASLIPMAADKVFMPMNATMMIHNPWIFTMGNAEELRKDADVLDKISVGMLAAYMAKIKDKTSEEKLKELLDDETWLSAQDAFDYGFVDELIEEKQIAACCDKEIFAAYKNVPENLRSMLAEGDKHLSEAERQVIIDETRKSSEERKKYLEVRKNDFV